MKYNHRLKDSKRERKSAWVLIMLKTPTKYSISGSMREWERETHNDRGTERERIRQRQTETGRDRDRQRQRESDTERKGEAIGKERLRETENPKIRLHFKMTLFVGITIKLFHLWQNTSTIQLLNIHSFIDSLICPFHSFIL